MNALEAARSTHKAALDTLAALRNRLNTAREDLASAQSAYNAEARRLVVETTVSKEDARRLQDNLATSLVRVHGLEEAVKEAEGEAREAAENLKAAEHEDSWREGHEEAARAERLGEEIARARLALGDKFGDLAMIHRRYNSEWISHPAGGRVQAALRVAYDKGMDPNERQADGRSLVSGGLRPMEVRPTTLKGEK